MADDPVFVYDKGGAASDKPLLVEDAVSFDHLPLHIAEQGKSHPNVLGKPLVGGEAVYTNADDLRISFLEIGDISLIRL